MNMGINPLQTWEEDCASRHLEHGLPGPPRPVEMQRGSL